MFSEQFMKESSHTRYRHRLQHASAKKREATVLSSTFELPSAKHMYSLPTATKTNRNVYSHHVSMDSKHKRSGLGVSSRALYNSKFHVIHPSTHPPLLQKRCKSQASLVASNVNHSVDHIVHIHSPVCNAPMKDLTATSRSCHNSFTRGLEGQCVSYRTLDITHSTDSVLSPPAIIYERSERSRSTYGTSSKVRSPLKHDFRRKMSTCSVSKISPKNEVGLQGIKHVLQMTMKDAVSGHNDINVDNDASKVNTDVNIDECSDPEKISSYDGHSDEDCEDEYLDDLLLLEIQRRREKDFGIDASSSASSASASWTDKGQENEYECDSLCTESESIEDVKHSEECCYESESVASQVTANELAEQDEESQRETDSISAPSPWPTDDSFHFRVPVASSLLNLPPSCEGGERSSAALTQSLFPEYFQPTIHFPLHNENYLPLPKEIRALLKWKVCSLTPNIVKSCSARAGFSKCTRGDTWMGYWGKHMKAESFRSIKEFQKINHFPGTFQIGRKDRLWRNLYRLQARIGKRNCDFVPQTYILPHDLALLKKDWEDGGKQKWILKPPASARGIGIKVVNRWKDIPKKKAVIVQRYLADPFLINGMKFDLRIYVFVSAYDPLKIYIFREGLARFATCKYSSSSKHISNRFIHLTNYSINKRNADFMPNTDETVCQGHKWGLLALWRYMSSELCINTEAIWEAIKDVVIKTIISSEHYVSSNVKSYVRNSSSVYELFGFDVMLDRNLKPWVLEVNISPSLHSNSQLDINIKGRLVRDLFNICGFKLYSKEILTGHDGIPRSPPLSADERRKHSHFIQRSLKREEQRKVIDNLTCDDLRILMAAEDELSRCGYFERIFPSPTSNKYRKYFETQRYYNVLLSNWTEKYDKCYMKGITVLKRVAGELKLKG